MKMSIFFLFFLAMASLSLATPPTSIDLSYDLSKGTLHVEAVHPTQNLDKNFVRLMQIFVNGQQVSALNYTRQEQYDKFTDEVPVTAKAGDVIKVDLFCASGGELVQEMKVEESKGG